MRVVDREKARRNRPRQIIFDDIAETNARQQQKKISSIQIKIKGESTIRGGILWKSLVGGKGEGSILS